MARPPVTALAFRVAALSMAAVGIVGASVLLTTPAALAGQSSCPTGLFPDLTSVAGPGGGYAMPKVTVKCSGGNLVVSSNGMPGYTFVSKTPNGLKEQNYTWTVPLKPAKSAKSTSIETRMGTLGFTVTGIPVFGPMEGPMPADSAFGDPVYNGLLDSCGGHTGYNSDYHDHTLITTSECNLAKRRVLGYAIDGFPIYNSYGCTNKSCTKTVKVTSGYVKTGNPVSNAWQAYTYRASGKAGQLDACNGRVEPDGTYGYHATSTFPYVIGCFKGTPVTQSGRAAEPMPPMGGQSQAMAVPPGAQGPGQQGPGQQGPGQPGPGPQGPGPQGPKPSQ